MRSLQILENTGNRLVAEQAPQTASVFGYVALLVAAAVLLWLVFQTRQYKAAIIPALAIVALSYFFVFSPPYPTFRLTLDKANRTLVSTGTVRGKVVSNVDVASADLSSADMQFNRGARTIVLIRRDGSTLYPLGEQQLQDEPDQYVVLNAIRQMIGQAPAAESR